jgi:hypothetical protein
VKLGVSLAAEGSSTEAENKKGLKTEKKALTLYVSGRTHRSNMYTLMS